MSKFNIGDKVICKFWPSLDNIACIGIIKNMSNGCYEIEVITGEENSGWWGERCLELAESPEFKGSIEFEVNV